MLGLLGRLIRLAWRCVRALVQIAARLVWRFSPTVRLALLLAIAAATASVAPAISQAAESLAVLIVAAAGLSLMIFRRLPR